MKDKILNGRTKIIVTFAAVALMGSGVLFTAMPVSASDGIGNHHFMGKQFRSHFNNLSPEQQAAHRANNLKTRKNRGEAITGFLGITEDELKNRIDNGDRIHDIVEEKGKTREDFRAYMMDYMQKHHLFRND